VRFNPSESKSFVAVLDSNGTMIDQDTSVEEAYERARRASPTGTVVADATVLAEPDGEPIGNPPELHESARRALVASRIRPTSIDWGSFDPITKDCRRVEEAREELRRYGSTKYNELLAGVEGTVYAPQREGEVGKRGGVAARFSPGWVRSDLLRQNQKMAKVLSGELTLYDSIGLSLLPHGASWRPPFDPGTKQARDSKGTATNCLYSTPECRKVCLVNTGQRALESGATAASWLFSHMLRDHTEVFLINLFDMCLDAFLKAENEGRSAWLQQENIERRESGECDLRTVPEELAEYNFRRFIRLNVLSDLPWELIAPGMIERICELARRALHKRGHSPRNGLMFYDYTKLPYRSGLDGFYDLTMSFSGRSDMFQAVDDVVKGMPGCAPRMAAVFVKREEDLVAGRYGSSYYAAQPGMPLSSENKWHAWKFWGPPVWNGDLSDIRPLDPKNVRVIGLTYKPPSYKIPAAIGVLTAKGKQKKFELEFVVPSPQLDRELPTFIVRVRQPDPDAPPIVMATQDSRNRVIELVPGGDIKKIGVSLPVLPGLYRD
jgi:hypothetical protein